MASDLPLNVALVAVAFHRAGGEATLDRIYQEMRTLDPEWQLRYKSEDVFEATIRKTIEDYCPQSQNFSPTRPPFFQRLGQGRYRVVPPQERDEVERLGRRLDQ
jgi:hypothetical protein